MLLLPRPRVLLLLPLLAAAAAAAGEGGAPDPAVLEKVAGIINLGQQLRSGPSPPARHPADAGVAAGAEAADLDLERIAGLVNLSTKLPTPTPIHPNQKGYKRPKGAGLSGGGGGEMTGAQ